MLTDATPAAAARRTIEASVPKFKILAFSYLVLLAVAWLYAYFVFWAAWVEGEMHELAFLGIWLATFSTIVATGVYVEDKKLDGWDAYFRFAFNISVMVVVFWVLAIAYLAFRDSTIRMSQDMIRIT